MSDEQLHARDRIVQQMSRDGLIEQNITQDTVTNISSRQADFVAGNSNPVEQAYDRSQNRIYYQAQEQFLTQGLVMPEQNTAASHDTLTVPVENSVITGAETEFASLINRVADNIDRKDENHPEQDIAGKAARLIDNKNQRLKSEIKKQKRIRNRMDEAVEEEDEKETDESERLQSDKKKTLNFKDDIKEQRGLKTDKKENKRLRFDKEEEEDEETEESDSDEDSFEKKLRNKKEEAESGGRLCFEEDDWKGVKGTSFGGRLASRTAGKALRRFVEEQEEDMDMGAAAAYRFSRNAVRSSKYLVRKGKLRHLKASNQEARRRLKSREEREVSEEGEVDDSKEKSRLQHKSRADEKLKTGSRYHNQQERETKKKAAQKAYQKKINQQRAMENTQRIEREKKFIAVVKSVLAKIAAAVKSSMAVVVGIVLFIIVLIGIFAYILFVLIQQGVTGAAAVYGGTYQSTYTDISDCEAYFRELETDLEEKIAKIEEEYPDCYEYIYDLGNIGHNPVELMSYIATKYPDFTLDMCQEELDSLFAEMYTLTVEIKEEPRERTKKDAAGNIVYDEEGNPMKETFMAEICYITLTVKPWDEIVSGRLTEDELERYQLYVASQGAQQVYSNPLSCDWKSKISCRFGYRIHPVTKEKDFHDGIDIAVPTGTPLYSCTDGTVTVSQYSDTAGNYIRVKTESGFTVTYMHLDSLGVSVGDTVSKGMQIGTTGNTGRSTGPHLHLEIRTPDNDPIDPTFIVANGAARE